MRKVMLGLALVLLSACSAPDGTISTSAQQQIDSDKLWLRTFLMLPEEPPVVPRYRLASWNYEPPSKKLPAVIFLHGCSGITTGSPQVTRMMTDMAKAGFAVFAPESPRAPYCDPRTLRAWITYEDIQLRLAEAKVTYDRISKLDWIDGENVFLAGFSMGGIATANYSGPEFRGHVILGTACTPLAAAPTVAGLKMPSSKPVMSIIGSDDEWYRPWHPGRHCGERAIGHTGPFIVLSGAKHDVSEDPKAMPAVVEFLNAHLKR